MGWWQILDNGLYRNHVVIVDNEGRRYRPTVFDSTSRWFASAQIYMTHGSSTTRKKNNKSILVDLIAIKFIGNAKTHVLIIDGFVIQLIKLTPRRFNLEMAGHLRVPIQPLLFSEIKYRNKIVNCTYLTLLHKRSNFA